MSFKKLENIHYRRQINDKQFLRSRTSSRNTYGFKADGLSNHQEAQRRAFWQRLHNNQWEGFNKILPREILQLTKNA